MAERIATELDVTGILAVELFETTDGRLLVNELAMRPHNTGHWSIDGAVTSQFENHLRAVLDLPLGATDARAPWSVMADVLTPRQREVVALVAEGLSNGEVADRLDVSVKAVEKHVSAALRRSGARSRLDLAHGWASGSVELVVREDEELAP